MKKKVLFSILSCLLVIVILYGLYLVSHTKYRENSVLEYLMAQGYARTEIKDIQAHHSFINVVLGYPEWQVNVVFEDEPSVVYSYGFDSSGEISQGGVSGGSANLEKEGLKHTEPPKLRIVDSKNELSYIVGLNQWNGRESDREDNFKLLMRDVTVSDLPFTALGEKISLEFLGQVPDSVRLTDCYLNPDGTQKFRVEDTVDINFSSGKGTFILEKNMALALSSNGADFVPGTSIRGFRLVCKWADNECEYAFIIRSDPPIIFEFEE